MTLNKLKQCLDEANALCDELMTQRLFAGRMDVLQQLQRRLAEANSENIFFKLQWIP